MAAYTIEDIELIRRKSGVSYQEAVALLDYHNGNVARALVDLERNGRIQPEAAQTAYKPSDNASSASAGSKSGVKNGLIDLLGKLYRARIKVSKEETPVLNVSALAGVAAVIFAPHMVIAGAIASMVLGYKFSFTKNDPAFMGENLERMVRSAADNVRNSVNDFARGFQSGAGNQNAGGHPYAADSQNAAERSYYSAKPSAPTASAAYSASAPTLNVPVQVESQDGSVTVEGDDEGYTSATIE